MSRPQLNIKFDGEGEKELLETVKTRAQDERISLKEFVLDALKNRLRVHLATQSTQPKPAVTKLEQPGRLETKAAVFQGQVKCTKL
jgi:hypothetical protein